MRRLLLLLAVLPAAAPLAVPADDLTLPDGRKFADYQVRKINPDSVLISFRNDQGEPDAAEIPIRELPENIRRFYPASASAPAAPVPAPAAAPASPVPRRKNAPAPGSQEALIEAMRSISDHFSRQLAALDTSDREGRAILAAQTRSRVEKSLQGYVREADCEFVAVWNGGIVVKIIGTPANSPLRSGDKLFIAGAKRPALPWFRGRFYPSAERIRCGQYGILPYCGDTLYDAADAVLTEIAHLAGEPLFFEPADSAESTAEPTAPAPVQINNIIVEPFVRGADYGRQYPLVIHRRGRHHPGPGPRPRPEPPPGPKPPPKPAPAPTPPLRQTGHPRDYGLLPSWAQPGKTGPSPPVR